MLGTSEKNKKTKTKNKNKDKKKQKNKKGNKQQKSKLLKHHCFIQCQVASLEKKA